MYLFKVLVVANKIVKCFYNYKFIDSYIYFPIWDIILTLWKIHMLTANQIISKIKLTDDKKISETKFYKKNI